MEILYFECEFLIIGKNQVLNLREGDDLAFIPPISGG